MTTGPLVRILDNGLHLLVEPRPGRGLASLALMVAAGGDDDPPGRHGMAHLVEHLMFPRAADEYGASDVESHVGRIEYAGGTCNAETHRDHTVFHTTLPSDALPVALEGEARRLLRFQPTSAVVGTEAKVIAEEIRGTGPGGRLWEAVLGGLHPGSRDSHGTVEELRHTTPTEAENFFRRHYTTDAMVLSVVGDVDPDRVVRLTAEAFGPLAPASGPAASSRALRRSYRSAEAGTHDRPAAVRQPLAYGRPGVAIGHALADPRGGLTPYLAQVVLAEVLGRRLQALVRREARLAAASVVCGYQGRWLSSAAPDLALVLLGHAPDSGVDEALGLWLTTAGELAGTQPSGAELRRAVNTLLVVFHRQADSLTSRAVTNGRSALLFDVHSGLDAVPRRLASLTPEDVSAAARDLLAASRTVTELTGAGGRW